MTDVLITAGELAELVKKEPCVIIDTRNPDAYAAGPLPGAVNVHDVFTFLATSTPEGIHELKTKFADAFGAAGLSGKETAVIYEQSMNSGFGQSCRGYYLLTMLGYPKIKVLHGGFDAWKAVDLPVTTDVTVPVKAAFAIVPEAAASLKIADVRLKPLKLRTPVPVELFMVWRRDHENQLLPSLIEIATEIAAPQSHGD